MHAWIVRFERGGLAALADRSHRPSSCPHQTDAETQALIYELRREHPGWGPRRIEHQLARLGVDHAPSRSAIYAEEELRLDTGEEILANYERYVEDRTVPDRLAGVFTDDVEARDLYLSLRAVGRCALWTHIRDENDVKRGPSRRGEPPNVHSRYAGVGGMYEVRLPTCWTNLSNRRIRATLGQDPILGQLPPPIPPSV